MFPRFPCPKCGRLLEPAGVIDHPGGRLPTYQCDECLKTVEMFGETVEIALTFCVDKDGNAFDPGDDVTLS